MSNAILQLKRLKKVLMKDLEVAKKRHADASARSHGRPFYAGQIQVLNQVVLKLTEIIRINPQKRLKP